METEEQQKSNKEREKRALLLKEFIAISSAELVSYMEKKKTQLRKVRARYLRGES